MRCSLASLAAVALLGTPLASFAHSTGREARTVEQCEKLKKGEVDGCKRCVTQKAKMHFHPNARPGHRCRPDNGKP